MNKFMKISPEQFLTDTAQNYPEYKYDNIKLPKRATKYSAGYDFFAISDFCIMPGMTKKIPSGIRVKLNTNSVLLVMPRSSLGFKYKLKLDNTIGVIDADYFDAKNEGHIWFSMTNMSSDKVLSIRAGEAIAQGIIVKYETAEEEKVTTTREGGIGSTNVVNNEKKPTVVEPKVEAE